VHQSDQTRILNHQNILILKLTAKYTLKHVLHVYVFRALHDQKIDPRLGRFLYYFGNRIFPFFYVLFTPKARGVAEDFQPSEVFYLGCVFSICPPTHRMPRGGAAPHSNHLTLNMSPVSCPLPPWSPLFFHRLLRSSENSTGATTPLVFFRPPLPPRHTWPLGSMVCLFFCKPHFIFSASPPPLHPSVFPLPLGFPMANHT